MVEVYSIYLLLMLHLEIVIDLSKEALQVLKQRYAQLLLIFTLYDLYLQLKLFRSLLQVPLEPLDALV